MNDTGPIILWFRRDLRLGDHPALTAAATSGRPVIPVVIHDEVVDGLGAAPKFRLGLSIKALADSLSSKGSRLILRRGRALDILRELVRDTGAGAVWWSRLYDPDARERDAAVKAALKDDGIYARSFAGHLLFEPWTVETQQGAFYKVYTPYWKAVRGRDLPAARSAPNHIAGPDAWPTSDHIEDWQMGAAMNRGADVVARHVTVGETAASHRLSAFIAHRVADYKSNRDLPGINGTSGLSENLTYGEISPLSCWQAGWRALHDGKNDAETFLKELVWREFAYHLIYHTPRITDRNWRDGWDDFPWNTNERRAEVKAWKQARTGVPFVDAAMRQMYVTGTMHNRARMIVASYLTKHLMCDWRIGQAWFADCLTDWDPASNAMGWQWVAGSGPDAAPYFRVFNPDTQAEKFDADATYRKAWIAEGQDNPPDTARAYFRAIPRRWGMAATDAYPDPVVSLSDGRTRALDAYAALRG